LETNNGSTEILLKETVNKLRITSLKMESSFHSASKKSIDKKNLIESAEKLDREEEKDICQPLLSSFSQINQNANAFTTNLDSSAHKFAAPLSSAKAPRSFNALGSSYNSDVKPRHSFRITNYSSAMASVLNSGQTTPKITPYKMLERSRAGISKYDICKLEDKIKDLEV
jgi:hypothetical protein